MTSSNEPITGDDARWKRAVNKDLEDLRATLEIIKSQISLLQKRVK